MKIKNNKCIHYFEQFLIYYAMFLAIVETSDICSANSNYFWKERKAKCVRCRGCKIGKWRNYTEKYTGPTGVHGDKDCLPCVPLPPGYYIDLNNKNENGVPQLKQCLVDCKYQNRHLKTPCSPTSDAQCGACLKGYYDAHENIDFPCSEIVTYQPNPRFPTQSNDKVSTTPTPAITKKPTDKFVDDDGDGGGDSNLTTILVATFCSVFGVFIIVLVVVYKRNHLRKGISLLFGDVETSDTSARSDTSSGASYRPIPTAGTEQMHNDDIAQMHNVVETDSPAELYCLPSPHVDRSGGRNPSNNSGQHHGDNGHHGNNNVHSEFFNPPCSDPTETSITPTSLHICSCFTQVDCHCDEIFAHPSFQDCLVSRDIFTLTARLICHDHIPFFKKIGISNSTYYQLNVKSDDFKDMCYDNLKQWSEEKGENATLKVYIEGLCHGQFCSITKEVSKQYLTQNNQNQTDGNEN